MRDANEVLRSMPPSERWESDRLLLHAAQSFDPSVWAASIQKTSPRWDVKRRAHIASAHKAALLIYLSRALQAQSIAAGIGEDLETQVSNIGHHLSLLGSDVELYKSAAWPLFISGAETIDPAKREWAVTRLQELWRIMPFGNIQSALEMLDIIWDKRNGAFGEAKADFNWVVEMKSLKANWLIL